MNDKWYKKSFRRNLIDMHIPDWDDKFFSEFNSEKYIECLKEAGVDSAYIYTDSCVGICNWPTKTGHMHSGLRGRDIIRELTEGLRREGINIILYMNIWSMWAYNEHPDWRCISPEGKGSAEYMWGQIGRYGVCCMNSPYRDFVFSLLNEVCTGYDFDGLWIDMILWRTMCTCPHCKKRFEEETGFDFPTVIDWESPAWNAYIKKREEWVCEFFEQINDRAKEIKPDITVMCNSSYFPMRILGENLSFYRLGEFVGGDFNSGKDEHFFECKLFNSVTKNKPFEYLSSIMEPSLNEHSIMKTEEKLKILMFSCLMNNGRYGFIDAIDPTGELNPAVYKRMREIFDVERQYEKYLSSDVTFLSDVGVYASPDSVIDYRDNGTPLHDLWDNTPHMKAAMGASFKLMEAHIPFEVITKYDIGRLSHFKVICLPDLYVMDNEEISAFTKYLENGGRIYASGHTALMMGDILGVETSGETSEEITFIRTVSDGFLPDAYDQKHPLTLYVSQIKASAKDGAEVLGKLTLPYVHPKDTTKFASAISNPPGKHTDCDSIIKNACKEGVSFYCAGDLETQTTEDHSNLFIKMIRELLSSETQFSSDTHPCVEITAYDRPDGTRIINLLNHQWVLPNVPVYNAKVKIATDSKTVKGLYHAPDDEPVPYTEKDGFITFTVPEITEFQMYYMEF